MLAEAGAEIVAFSNGFPIRDLKTQAELDPGDERLFSRDGKVWLLRNLAVKQSMQGQGLGRELAREQIRLAQAAGVRSVRLTAPPELSGWYTGLGFTMIRSPEAFHGLAQAVWERAL